MNFLIDCGHGGVAFGQYLTAGKQAFTTGEQKPLYEGEFNRRVAGYIEAIAHCGRHAIEVLNPGPINVKLKERIAYINTLYERLEGALAVISVHANADGKASAKTPWTAAGGHTVFIAKKASAVSEIMADLISLHLDNSRDLTLRNRGVKRANFAILKKVSCPSVLVECGFMTNFDDYRMMLGDGPIQLAKAIMSAINRVQV